MIAPSCLLCGRARINHNYYAIYTGTVFLRRDLDMSVISLKNQWSSGNIETNRGSTVTSPVRFTEIEDAYRLFTQPLNIRTLDSDRHRLGVKTTSRCRLRNGGD